MQFLERSRPYIGRYGQDYSKVYTERERNYSSWDNLGGEERSGENQSARSHTHCCTPAALGAAGRPRTGVGGGAGPWETGLSDTAISSACVSVPLAGLLAAECRAPALGGSRSVWPPGATRRRSGQNWPISVEDERRSPAKTTLYSGCGLATPFFIVRGKLLRK